MKKPADCAGSTASGFEHYAAIGLRQLTQFIGWATSISMRERKPRSPTEESIDHAYPPLVKIGKAMARRMPMRTMNKRRLSWLERL